jgi:hypothetical protein
MRACASDIAEARGAEKAASATASSRPSWSMRADTVVRERPARSTAVSIATAPSRGRRV